MPESATASAPVSKPSTATSINRFLIGIILIQAMLFFFAQLATRPLTEQRSGVLFGGMLVTVILLTLTVLGVGIGWLFKARCQFSLASLFLLCTTVAIPCAWFLRERELAREHDKWIKSIQGKQDGYVYARYRSTTSPWPFSEVLPMSAESIVLTKPTADDLEHVAYCRTVERLVLNEAQAPDSWFRHLSDFKELEMLHLTQTTLGDDGLAHLSKLRQLLSLDLTGTQITDAGISHLDRLAMLEELLLAKTGITDDGLAQLAKPYRSNFRALDLSGTRITDKGLAALRGNLKLSTLILNDTEVGDDGLKHLDPLLGLLKVSLEGTQITNRGLRHLSTLDIRYLDLSRTAVSELPLDAWPQMRTLTLSKTGIGDDDIGQLRQFTMLQRLRLGGTRVTDAGVAHLNENGELQLLGLEDTAVTDVTVKHLLAHRNLRWLYLGNTSVSEEGKQRLRETIKELTVQDREVVSD
jgi:hypothetical protein